MTSRIKLLCTVGPASMDARTIRRLQEAGVDLFRINLSHTPLEAVRGVIRTLKGWTDVPVCLDTEGAQVRTGRVTGGETRLVEGAEVSLSGDGAAGALPFTPPEAFAQMRPGDLLSVDFHSVLLRLDAVDGLRARATVLSGGRVGTNKACNLDKPVVLPALSDKDRAAIEIGVEEGVRDVALSFCSRVEDVAELRALAGVPVTVISKVESVAALKNLEGILEASDAILIDRGDLSREVPLVRIPSAQKEILAAARRAGKPGYVATNLLESMIAQRRPTRAEVNDVINTLLDGAAGLVLAAETAIGAHPVECAEMIAGLIREFRSAGTGSLAAAASDANRANLAVPPHGGRLTPAAPAPAPDERTMRVPDATLRDALLLGSGLYSPLEAFMSEPERRSIVERGRLPDGVFWPEAVTLPAGASHAGRTTLEDSRGRRVTLDGLRVVAVSGAPSPAPQKSRIILENKGWTKVVGVVDGENVPPGDWDAVIRLVDAEEMELVPGELRVAWPATLRPSPALLAIALKNLGCSHLPSGDAALLTELGLKPAASAKAVAA